MTGKSDEPQQPRDYAENDPGPLPDYELCQAGTMPWQIWALVAAIVAVGVALMWWGGA